MKASYSVALITFVSVPTTLLSLEVLLKKSFSATILRTSQAEELGEIYQASDLTEEK